MMLQCDAAMLSSGGGGNLWGILGGKLCGPNPPSPRHTAGRSCEVRTAAGPGSCPAVALPGTLKVSFRTALMHSTQADLTQRSSGEASQCALPPDTRSQLLHHPMHTPEGGMPVWGARGRGGAPGTLTSWLGTAGRCCGPDGREAIPASGRQHIEERQGKSMRKVRVSPVLVEP